MNVGDTVYFYRDREIVKAEVTRVMDEPPKLWLDEEPWAALKVPDRSLDELRRQADLQPTPWQALIEALKLVTDRAKESLDELNHVYGMLGEEAQRLSGLAVAETFPQAIRTMPAKPAYQEPMTGDPVHDHEAVVRNFERVFGEGSWNRVGPGSRKKENP